MPFACTDILLVENGSGDVFVVEAPSNMADVGCIVVFDEGNTGTVIQRAFIGNDAHILDLVRSIAETYEAEEIFLSYWKKEKPHESP